MEMEAQGRPRRFVRTENGEFCEVFFGEPLYESAQFEETTQDKDGHLMTQQEVAALLDTGKYFSYTL
jgi:hypothetical protein